MILKFPLGFNYYAINTDLNHLWKMMEILKTWSVWGPQGLVVDMSGTDKPSKCPVDNKKKFSH